MGLWNKAQTAGLKFELRRSDILSLLIARLALIVLMRLQEIRSRGVYLHLCPMSAGQGRRGQSRFYCMA